MHTSLLVLFVHGCLLAMLSGLANASPHCDHVLKTYEELGCTAVQSSGTAVCSASFQCPDFKTLDADRCHLNGKSFDVGEVLSGDQPDLPSCVAECRCLKSDDRPAQLTCVDIECPELFSGRPFGCVSQYSSLDQCCQSSEICDHGKIAEMGECHYEGETYRLNQRMYPNNETCYECLCTEDFNGAVPVPSNSNCKRIDCGVELRHLGEIRSGCVPVYFGNRCCPIDFKCPTDQDAIDEAIAPTSGTDNDGAVCKFGALSLKRGQAIKSTDKCNKCECSTPPLLTCTKTYDC